MAQYDKWGRQLGTDPDQKRKELIVAGIIIFALMVSLVARHFLTLTLN